MNLRYIVALIFVSHLRCLIFAQYLQQLHQLHLERFLNRWALWKCWLTEILVFFMYLKKVSCLIVFTCCSNPYNLKYGNVKVQKHMRSWGLLYLQKFITVHNDTWDQSALNPSERGQCESSLHFSHLGKLWFVFSCCLVVTLRQSVKITGRKHMNGGLIR